MRVVVLVSRVMILVFEVRVQRYFGGSFSEMLLVIVQRVLGVRDLFQ